MPRELVIAPRAPFKVSKAGQVAEIVLQVYADGTVALRSTHGGRFSSSVVRVSQVSLLDDVLPRELGEAMGDFRAAQSLCIVTGAVE
jgi:hypothetical protein